jgi:hypothetical protein
MIVLIGLNFDKNMPFKSVDKSTEAKTASVAKTHRGKNPLSGQSTRVDFDPLLNKDLTKKEIEIKKRERPARKKREPLSEYFKPDQEREAIAKAISARCNISIEDLLIKFKTIEKKKNKTSLNWQLEFELFLAREKPSLQKSTYQSKHDQELKSTVLEYGPGHPTWEANQEWKRKQLKGNSHGSEIARDHTRGNGVQKVEGYLF